MVEATILKFKEMGRQKKESEDAKIWLSRAYKNNEKMMSIEQNIRFWETLAEKATSNPSEPMNTNNNEPRMEKYSIKIADALAENKRMLCELVDTKREIETIVSFVKDSLSQVILMQRYVNCKNWGEIANLMRYDEIYTKGVLHNRALRDVSLLIKMHKQKPFIMIKGGVK